MSEIARLRQRMSNVGKNVKEYRMTVTEAKNLLAEIDKLLEQKEKPQIEEVVNRPAIITRIMDGGTF